MRQNVKGCAWQLPALLRSGKHGLEVGGVANPGKGMENPWLVVLERLTHHRHAIFCEGLDGRTGRQRGVADPGRGMENPFTADAGIAETGGQNLSATEGGAAPTDSKTNTATPFLPEVRTAGHRGSISRVGKAARCGVLVNA